MSIELNVKIAILLGNLLLGEPCLVDGVVIVTIVPKDKLARREAELSQVRSDLEMLR